MLKPLIVLTGLFLVAVSAQAVEPPVICKSGLCSESQAYIEERFFENGPLLQEPVSQTVYSGPCYVQGRGYNPEHKHWGVIFFDARDSKTFFGGKFGFFHKTNPYRDLSPADAREQFTSMYKPDHTVSQESDYAFVHLNRDSDDIWYYWFTQNSEDGTVYLKAYWTVQYFLMCELSPNSPKD